MKTIRDFIIDYKDYKKIEHTCRSLVICTLYNPKTKDIKNFTVDDLEYEYGGGLINREYDLKTLEYIRSLSINDEAIKDYYRHIGKIQVGDNVEVIKGRKYPIGLQGKIKKLYDYTIPNTYNKGIIEYAILEDGKKIQVKNLKIIAE